MKHIASFALALLPIALSAQLADGSLAPNFVAEDLNGNEWELHNLIGDGKRVVLHFSAAWSPESYGYLESGALPEIHRLFGPDGTGDLMVFLVESDPGTTVEDLTGLGAIAAGNWSELTPFPILNDGAEIFEAFQGQQFPTVLAVGQDTTVTQLGQAEANTLAERLFLESGILAHGPAASISQVGTVVDCGGAQWPIQVDLVNVGGDTLNHALFSMTWGDVVDSLEWAGELAPGQSATIDCGIATEPGPVEVALLTVNDSLWNLKDTQALTESLESTNYVQIRIRTDQWPEETAWSIQNDAGEVIEALEMGGLTEANADVIWDVYLPEEGCYHLDFMDDYGDGLFASQWGNFANGSIEVYSMDGVEEVAELWRYNGSLDGGFDALSIGIQITSIASLRERERAPHLTAHPNPTNGALHVVVDQAGGNECLIQLMDLSGRILLSREVGKGDETKRHLDINMELWPTGQYLLRVQIGDRALIQQISKL